MKNIIILFLFLTTFLFAQENKFNKSAETKNAVILQDGDSKDWCSVCGMKLTMFYKTNHAVKLDDGSTKQYCSIRCMIADEPNYKNHVKQRLVVDSKSEKFIDVKDAYYVIGSKAPGTMTKVSKIAFSSKTDAKSFNKKFGGSNILKFDATYKLAKQQMKKDNVMLMKKKEMKVYPKGEKLFKKFCEENIDPKKFKSISELKALLKSSNCKKMNEKQLQMIALYLWDVKRIEKKAITLIQDMKIPKIEKCPVCGMFVYKYPKWAAILEVSSNNKTSKLYFDGVKDLMKFYFEPNKWGNYGKIKIEKVIVTDYYSQKFINGFTAFYVAKSDVLGPMGNELIPFANEEEAKAFIKDHGGNSLGNFESIIPQIIKMLDE